MREPAAILRRLVLLACSLRGARASEEFYFQVDNYAQVFFNGDLLYQDVNEGIDYGTIVLKSAPSVGDVLAIKGSVAGASSERGGILARLGEIASSSRWKCVSLATFESSSLGVACPGGPYSLDCDDSAWPNAIAQVDADYAYRGAALTPFWRGRGDGDDDAAADTYTTRADWIWTADTHADNPVVCRYTVRASDTPGEPDRCRNKRGPMYSSTRRMQARRHAAGRYARLLLCALFPVPAPPARARLSVARARARALTHTLPPSRPKSSRAQTTTCSWRATTTRVGQLGRLRPRAANRPQPGDVYGLHGVNDRAGHASSLGGVVASIGDSHDTVTNAYWKCSATWEEGWAAPGFNDSHWSFAVAQPDDCCGRDSNWDPARRAGSGRARAARQPGLLPVRRPRRGTAWHVSTYRAHVGPGRGRGRRDELLLRPALELRRARRRRLRGAPRRHAPDAGVRDPRGRV